MSSEQIARATTDTELIRQRQCPECARLKCQYMQSADLLLKLSNMLEPHLHPQDAPDKLKSLIKRSDELNTEYGRERHDHCLTKAKAAALELSLVDQQELNEQLQSRAEVAERQLAKLSEMLDCKVEDLPQAFAELQQSVLTLGAKGRKQGDGKEAQ